MKKEDIRKIAIGAGLAIAGALVAYGLEAVIPAIQQQGGTYGPAIAALAAVVLNAARKWVQSQQKQEGEGNG